MSLESKVSITLLASIFLLAPLYIQPSVGGSGLYLTYNISAWLLSILFISSCFLLVIKQKKFFVPKQWLLISLFPITVILIGVIGQQQSDSWVFRQLYVLLGALFLLCLFQLRLTEKHIHRLLYFITLSVLVHGFIGVFQIHFSAFLPNLLNSNDNVPRGIFKQVNVHASYLATGVIISLFLLSRAKFNNRSFQIISDSFLLVSFFVASYVVIASGSRTGLLALCFSIPAILLAESTLLRRKKIIVLLLVEIVFAFYLANTEAGLGKTVDKTAMLVEQNYSNARIAIYSICFDLIKENPWIGYGIGNFKHVWSQQATVMSSLHPEVIGLPVVSHPHNELMYWMIEGGILSVLAILAFMYAVFKALHKSGLKSAFGYIAMLFPISLHTQVELPFYISSLHWFLWLFLIFLALRHDQSSIALDLSKTASALTKVSVSLLTLSGFLFIVHSARAQQDFHTFLYDKSQKPPYLQIALKNPYYRPLAEQAAMVSMLDASIKNNDIQKVFLYKNWANDYLRVYPDLRIYRSLVKASKFLRPEQKGCEVLEKAMVVYGYIEDINQEYNINCH